MSQVNETYEGTSITTKAPKAVESGKKPEGWSISLPDPFAEKSLDELKEAFGEEPVCAAAIAQLRVKYQAAVRSLAEAGKSDEEIASTMSTWKPGDKLGLGGDPTANILKNFGNMSPEQQAQIIAQLQGMQQG